MRSDDGFPWEAQPPTEHGKHWIEIKLAYPVNPWEHEGAGEITWGANLDRLAPFGEEAATIIKEAWERRGEKPSDRGERERRESRAVDRVSSAGASLRPGWAEHVERHQYWVHLALSAPVNERWIEERWGGQLINDGIVKRSVSVEATTELGRRALRIIEALHGAHPHDELDPPERGAWYDQ